MVFTLIKPLISGMDDLLLVNRVFFVVNSVELQWLEHLWDHKICSRQGQFEPVRVDNSVGSGGIIRISLIFYMKVCCVFSLESPH